MKLPTINEPLKLVVKGRNYKATCTDVFDGGYGYYFDLLFPKTSRFKFFAGQQFGIPALGATCHADFVSHSTREPRTVRFLIPKWT